MACFYHENVVSVCTCNTCSKQLCRDCSIEIGIEISCVRCFESFLDYQENWLKKIKNRLFLGIFLGLIAIFIIISTAVFKFKEFNLILWVLLFITIPFITFPVTYFYMSKNSSFQSIWMRVWIAFIIGPFMFLYIVYRYFKVKKKYLNNLNMLIDKTEL